MRSVLILLVFLSCSLPSVSAQGIEFYHGTWEEALLKAKQEDKIIFVDAYTTWCGPCKRMSANTFPDPEVGKLFNQYFLSLKIDMEKDMGIEFRKKFPVSAYPTLFFIDFDGELVRKTVGAKSPADLIALAENVLSKFDKSTKYETAYVAGDRSYQLVYDYVAALNKSGKPSVKIANDYLAEQDDLSTEDNLRFILEAASQVDCQCFDLFEEYKAQIGKLVDKEVINAKVRSACDNTVMRAIEFESPELIDLAVAAMKRHIPAEADRFKSESEIHYALALHALGNIDELVTQYVKKYLKNDPEGLNLLAIDLDKFASDDKASRILALDLAQRAATDKNTTSACVTTYANLVYKENGKEAAVKILDEALLKTEDQESKDYKALKALKNKIEQS
jgi:thiol-disulfide isomerase/thioredoxin